MFELNAKLTDTFVEHVLTKFQTMFPQAQAAQCQTLEGAARSALEYLLRCDCPYHDANHTIMVTDVGQTVLHGRQLARGDLAANDWIQAVIAMLFHDIGYLKNLLRADTDHTCIVDPDGSHVAPPAGSTDAFLKPFHVTRGIMFVNERFANDPVVDTDVVAQCIEMTRFPVPRQPGYQPSDTLAGIVRCADLVGQMADPQYLQKLTRLYAEFVETGDASRMGITSAGDLREAFPDFFYDQVHPYLGPSVAYLKRTPQGQQWLANLYRHLDANESEQGDEITDHTPELMVQNG
jgi:hypothetical protein